MRKAHPHHPTEDDCGPVGRNIKAVLKHVARRRLHPAIVHHDPEGAQSGTQRHHDDGDEIEQWRQTRSAEDQNPKERSFERERGKALIGQ